MDGYHVASVGYADDVALVAETRGEAQQLVAAYHRWCTLLGLRIHMLKTQVWTNSGAQHPNLEEVRVMTHDGWWGSSWGTTRRRPR